MSALSSRNRRLAIAATGATVLLAGTAPAIGASTVSESLTNFKITGASSAKAGAVTFKVKNATSIGHELVVIKTNTKAAKLKIVKGRASETGKVKQVEVGAHKSATLKVTLKKGHYALICNVGDHYMAGMHKDFTVK
jgi:uncharacterized cupredoxin-like copper-binding protein